MADCQALISNLRAQGEAGTISIGDAVNLAILEEMIRDPTTVIHAEDLQAGSSYNIPKMTQQTFGKLRGADEIIDEGHFIGKALGEGMNGYRPYPYIHTSLSGRLDAALERKATNKSGLWIPATQ